MNNDLISRNALKEKLKNRRYEIEQDEIDKGWNLGIGVSINLTETAPTVELERPKGEWISTPYAVDYESDCQCSVCHITVMDGMSYNFCPNCGAEMRGNEKNETDN